jgi:hypothetical protein
VTFLHYGKDVRVEVDDAAVKVIMEQIAAHASRGGWVSVTDRQGLEWHLLVSAGIPIWLNKD